MRHPLTPRKMGEDKISSILQVHKSGRSTNSKSNNTDENQIKTKENNKTRKTKKTKKRWER